MRTTLLLAALLLTTTASAQWQIQPAPTTADLRGIHALSNGVAWASGSEGTVLRTTDDGAHWLRCATPPGADHLDFRGIQAFDASTAIVMSSGKGPLSRLYKTTDACQSWKLVLTNPDKEGSWDAVRVTSAKTALMIGDPVPHTILDRFKIKTFFHFPLYGTVDAGDTWNRLDTNNLFALSDNKGRPTEFIFGASNSSLMDQCGLIIYATGGSFPSLGLLEIIDHPNPLICKSRCSMSSSSKVPLKSGPDAGAFSLATKDGDSSDRRLVVVGGDYADPENRDGTAATCSRDVAIGTRFTCYVAQTPPHGFRSAVAYSPATKTWITVGPNGTDISTDDGRNWRPLKPIATDPPDADQHWNALSLPFVVGPHGRIGRLRPDARTPGAP